MNLDSTSQTESTSTRPRKWQPSETHSLQQLILIYYPNQIPPEELTKFQVHLKFKLESIQQEFVLLAEQDTVDQEEAAERDRVSVYLEERGIE